MRRNTVASIVAIALLVVAVPLAHASGREGGGRKPYPCNPQQECLARAARLKGAAAEAARRDCSRMPTTGTCYAAPSETPGDRREQDRRK